MPSRWRAIRAADPDRIAGYLRPEAMNRRLRDLARSGGPRVAHVSLGESVERRGITALTIAGPGRRPSGARPLAMVVGTIHGLEVVASELALRLAERLAAPDPDPLAAALLQRCDVTIVPVANPDGRARALASIDRRAFWRPAPRRNAHGVDLNRNFPLPDGARRHWSPQSGTRLRSLPWYRGAAPLSEPEAAALAAAIEARPPVGLLNLHSAGRILTHPWGCKPDPPADADAFGAMAEAFRAHQPRWTYRASQSRAWYPILGSSNDWCYDRFGTLAMTVEIGSPGASVRRRPRLAGSAFWWANPLDLRAHLDNDDDGCLAALRVACDVRAPEPEPTGPTGPSGPADQTSR